MALNETSFLKRCRADFFAGLALVLPGVITLAVVVWIFRNVSDVTNTLLFFLPMSLTLGGTVYAFSIILAVFLICLAGRYGRNYLGRKAMEWVDGTIMRVPLMNKIYGTVKQVNESFSTNKSSFKQVVLVPFPHPRSRAVGFVTGEQSGLGPEKLVSVFIPTTPNPTSGFLVLIPESDLIKLDMSVADGIKYTISLGAISPEHAGLAISTLSNRTAPPAQDPGPAQP